MLRADHQADLGEAGIRQSGDHIVQKRTSVEGDHRLDPGVSSLALLSGQGDAAGGFAHTRPEPASEDDGLVRCGSGNHDVQPIEAAPDDHTGAGNDQIRCRDALSRIIAIDTAPGSR